jgi:hypothetical protein
MFNLWREASWKERISTILLTILAVAFCAAMTWGVLTGRIKFPAPVNRNAIPANVVHSPLASERLETCVRSNVSVSTSGGQRVGDVNTPVSSSKHIYEAALIECLYAAGFELKYNGEPVRRVVESTPEV